ncbi:uncharacterized protein ATNIH1004_002850 [Aspergillus tanneri]|uniref:Uncharacterized protein n=1 Tax=Aspergillus tanneri TaxID=1220188 RepID=A0A5M9MZS1_9EURO|nr:uncharacterized protein ATNIH1004_002850 [Aspergillus tanneri]KAA8650169.1 hypothetical protein ATNIH1004_002850 [Aspergillus tanneri]
MQGITPLLTETPPLGEMLSIRPGSIFVWEEARIGRKKLHDGISWRIIKHFQHSFLYRDRGGCGLLKQLYTLNTSNGQRIHVQCYFRDSDVYTMQLQQPTTDPLFRDIRVQMEIYTKRKTGSHHPIQAGHIEDVCRKSLCLAQRENSGIAVRTATSYPFTPESSPIQQRCQRMGGCFIQENITRTPRSSPQSDPRKEVPREHTVRHSPSGSTGRMSPRVQKLRVNRTVEETKLLYKLDRAFLK